MHHITSEILTFHLSPTLSRVALTSLTMNGQTLACSVTLFASIGSVRWLRPNAARSQPLAACEKACGLSTWKPLTATDPLILSAGYGRAKIIPRYRWSDQCTELIYRCDMRSRGFQHKYPNLASCYFDKVLLKQKVRMSCLMCFMFYQHQIRKKEGGNFFFFFFFFAQRCILCHFLDVADTVLENTNFCPKLRIFSILNTNFSFQRLAALLYH